MKMLASIMASAALVTFPTFAQAAPEHGDHADHKPEIVVTAGYDRDLSDILSGTSVLSGEELRRDLRPTIGETLTHQPGVSATSFGPNASRPVLRGFQGERVRVLTDGIGSFDVSNTSVDHAVAINPLTADRIEVLRGPSALLFGSSAIGGVVNVVDTRIPRSIPDETIHLDVTATYAAAANERSGGTRIDVPLGDGFVIHFDGSYTKTDDLRTGTYILTPALRALAAQSGDPEIRSLADLRGRLPNSAGLTWEIAGGAAFITDQGNIGFSITRTANLYGVPLRYSLVPEIEAEQVRLDMDQTRVDWRAELTPASGFLKAIRLRGGQADYRHDEIEDTGAVGTSFFSQGWEGRLELVQRERNGWDGAVGAQFFLRELDIVGEEKFLPRNETQQYGLFIVQNLDLGFIRAEAGGRIEQSIVSARSDDDLGNPDVRRSFTALSGSLGASMQIADGWRLGLNGSYTERAPAAEELFANGPHAGTHAFEVGNPNFTMEKSKGLELSLRGKGDRYSFSASVYRSWFDGFIFDSPTGITEDDLPVFQYAQANARYSGIEIEASWRIAQLGNYAVNLDGLGDFIHAKIIGDGPAPRIPALRLLGGIEAQSDVLTARLEVEWVDGQERIAAFETSTSGYTMVNASSSWQPFGKDSNMTLTFSANNLFNVVTRRHASVLKDYAPQSGRDIRISARFSY